MCYATDKNITAAFNGIGRNTKGPTVGAIKAFFDERTYEYSAEEVALGLNVAVRETPKRLNELVKQGYLVATGKSANSKGRMTQNYKRANARTFGQA